MCAQVELEFGVDLEFVQRHRPFPVGVLLDSEC
jgi:hypothetical protein